MQSPRQRRTKKNKNIGFYPQGIIEIIQTYYPDRYSILSEDLETFRSLETLFSEEEWIDILTKSRHSYKRLIKMKKLRTRTIK